MDELWGSLQNELNKILISYINGNIAKEYLSGSTDIYTDKKAGTKQPSNFIFIFSNKENELEYQSKLLSHVLNSIKESITFTSVNVGDLRKDSLLKVELIYGEKFRASVAGGRTFWYVDLETRAHITKNGQNLKDETFLKSTSFMNGKIDKWEALEDVIVKSEKRISKILDDYIPME